jgi:hypothetical protein
MTVKSLRFQLRKEDIISWAKTALIFLGPALLVFMGSILDILPQDAKWYAIALYLGNESIALFKKWLSENKY